MELFADLASCKVGQCNFAALKRTAVLKVKLAELSVLKVCSNKDKLWPLSVTESVYVICTFCTLSHCFGLWMY